LKLLLDKVFEDMHESCIFFFDDLPIATDGTLDEHINIVDEVLQRIIKAGLKLRPNKLNLAKKTHQNTWFDFFHRVEFQSQKLN